MQQIIVAALYRFARFPDYQSFRTPLLQCMQEHGVRGTLLLAPEGINGTIAGSRVGVDAVLGLIRADARFAGTEAKESLTDHNPFYRAKVKFKKEIVTLGADNIDPNHIVGSYVEPADWNALIADPEVLLVDTRNDYEHRIGTFKGALNPGTRSFREFPGFVARQLDPARHRKVAMFCTGGIRCEKSTAFLKQQGFEQVYHLRGGILKYLEDVAESDSLWQGECFVFDNRVTVNHDLEAGNYRQCHACRMPVSAEDRTSEYFVEGISCPHCHEHLDHLRARRFAERERQKQLANQRGEQHIGRPMGELMGQRRREKLRFKERQRERTPASGAAKVSGR